MPAKIVPYVVMMPEGFDNSHCKSSGCNNNGCEFSGNYCPLANAKKAVEVSAEDSDLVKGLPVPEAPYKEFLLNNEPVTLYAVEVKK